MPMHVPRLAAALLAVTCLAPTPTASLPFADAQDGLAAFESEAELARFLRRLKPKSYGYGGAEDGMDSIVVTGSRVVPITNTQEPGVDEGGIVKLRGDTLVILRRGRLFTISLAGGDLRLIDTIDAFPPGAEAEESDWYDEMLVTDDRVVVVGYSYARGGTEINRFRLDDAGRLRFEDATHLRSDDYYSSRNYASRLIGTRLVYYTPLGLDYRTELAEILPAARPWRPGEDKGEFRPITRARQVFIAPRDYEEPANLDALHTMVSCDLAAPRLDCSARSVLGPSSRTYYVSPSAIYLWASDAWSGDAQRRGAQARLFRLPFDAGRPASIAARGAPVDQFSFREDPARRTLDVLVRADGGGDQMWRPEVSSGAVALLSIPLARFGDGEQEVPLGRYRPMPFPAEPGYWGFRNRFVGDYVLYGASSETEDGVPARNLVYAAPVAGGAVQELRLDHGVDRIETLGRDAVVVGERDGEALGFTAVELAGARPGLGARFNLPAASEGESRSHAFFYSPDPTAPDGARGTLGLPIEREAGERFRHLFEGSAALLFLRRDESGLRHAGELAAASENARDDACIASCADWYGNALGEG